MPAAPIWPKWLNSRVAPTSAVIRSASFIRSLDDQSCKRPCIGPLVGRHAGPAPVSKAERAASTARSTSASTASGAVPTISSVAGLTTVMVLVDAGPPTRRRCRADRRWSCRVPLQVRHRAGAGRPGELAPAAAAYLTTRQVSGSAARSACRRRWAGSEVVRCCARLASAVERPRAGWPVGAVGRRKGVDGGRSGVGSAHGCERRESRRRARRSMPG